MSSPNLAFSGGGGGGGGVPHGGTPGGDSLGSGGFGTDARPARSPSQTSLSALAASGGPAGAGQAAVKRLSAGSLAATAPQLPHAPAPALFQDLALLVAGSGRSTHGDAAAGDKYFLRAQGQDTLLVIDRVTHHFSLEDDTGQLKGLPLRSICGLLGVVRLLAGPYLIVIVRRRQLGRIAGHTVWEVVETDVLPIARTVIHLSEAQTRHEATYVAMLNAVLATPGLYFSYSYDLTHNLQRLYSMPPESNFFAKPIHERADARFHWNRALQTELARIPELSGFMLPVIQGFVSITETAAINSRRMTFALISRRSVQRAGTRFNRRGVDHRGQVANFVETEQLVEIDNFRASFVQTRGSVPVFWRQVPDLRYKPPIHVNSYADHAMAFQRHLHEQIQFYGPQAAINLIDQKGHEKNLGDAYSAMAANCEESQMQYFPFDFHKECSKLRWDRLSILMEQVAPVQARQRFFLVEHTEKQTNVLSRQHGVFRTNCIDCLDRTNVVQSMLARLSLQQVLWQIGALRPSDSVANHAAFGTLFKGVWADNADTLSKQYSGSGALKTDYTRTGTRTKRGLIMDGYNSLLRYYKNNLTDGFRQDAMDLFLGNYTVNPSEGVSVPSPFEARKRGTLMRLLPLIILLALSMLFITLLVPTASMTLKAAYLGFWLLAIIGSSLAIVVYRRDFVDMPCLVRDEMRF